MDSFILFSEKSFFPTLNYFFRCFQGEQQPKHAPHMDLITPSLYSQQKKRKKRRKMELDIKMYLIKLQDNGHLIFKNYRGLKLIFNLPSMVLRVSFQSLIESFISVSYLSIKPSLLKKCNYGSHAKSKLKDQSKKL